MEFEMNEQRAEYLSARGKVVLSACPGSGKTTVVAKKLEALVQEYPDKYGDFRGIACLSFTNTAKDEINEAYNKITGTSISFPHNVSTIDSFINRYITLPFYYLLKHGCTRPKILDSTTILDDMWKVNYVKNGKKIEGLQYKINSFKAKNGRSIFHSYPPSKIRIESDGSYTVDGKKPSAEKVDLAKFKEYCSYVKESQFKKGLISSADSAFLALILLKRQIKIGKWLVRRFPHIIVDEAQDNSEIQHKIFELLVERGLKKIEFIGDPYQSLYEWRDARPNLFLDKYNDKINWIGLDLSDNRRSPQRVIDCFSIIRSTEDTRINSVTQMDLGIPVTVYKYDTTNTSKVIGHFDSLCSESEFELNQVVVRGDELKNQLLGNVNPQRPWNNSEAYEIISSKNYYKVGDIKSAVKVLRKVVVRLLCAGNSPEELKEYELKIKEDIFYNSILMRILDEMPSLSLTVGEWTIEVQDYFTEVLKLTSKLNLGIKRKSKYFSIETLNEPVEFHFKAQMSKGKTTISTVHQVKGKSLDSILVFFNEKKHHNNIVFEDIVNCNEEFPKEKQRIIYVALSRAKHFLAMAFPKSVSDDDIILKFGKEIKIVSESELYSSSSGSN